MYNRLHRSRTDQMIGGVCAGLGTYLGIDPVFVRLFFVLLALPGAGIGVMLYLILWVILPYPDEGQVGNAGTVINGSGEVVGRARVMGGELRNAVQSPHPQTGLVIGAALVILGIFYLLNELHLPFLYWLRPGLLWPILLIIAGVVLVWRRMKEGRA